MYAKVFQQMYQGSLCTVGPWEALVTFQQMLVLADKDGWCDMTREAISRHTTIPLDIINKGIDALEKPDPYSRTAAEEGRRIVRIADHRDWGWQIVNYKHYRKIQREEERKQYHAERYQRLKKTKGKQDSTIPPIQPIQPIAYAEAEAEAKFKRTVEKHPETELEKTRKAVAKDILEFLNEKTGRKYRPVPANLKLIIARLKQGYTPAQCRAVIAIKRRQWQDDEKMREFLRPATLFNDTKFNQYVAEAGTDEQMS
jgi:uncharacterized phage protein (TIGR02220 family)